MSLLIVLNMTLNCSNQRPRKRGTLAKSQRVSRGGNMDRRNRFPGYGHHPEHRPFDWSICEWTNFMDRREQTVDALLLSTTSSAPNRQAIGGRDLKELQWMTSGLQPINGQLPVSCSHSGTHSKCSASNNSSWEWLSSSRGTMMPTRSSFFNRPSRSWQHSFVAPGFDCPSMRSHLHQRSHASRIHRLKRGPIG